MKKAILYGFLFLLVCSLATAMGVPHPVFGTITLDGNALSNADVEIHNLDTGASVTETTSDTGMYQAELANFDSRYREGDRLEITLAYCGSINVCTKEVIVAGGNNQVNWNIGSEGTDNGIVIPIDLPDDIVIVQPHKICWDGTEVNVNLACPERLVCNDGTEVHSADLCPEGELNWAIVAAIGIVIVGLGILWAYAVQKGIKAKYRWVPGMAGILKYNLNKYKTAKTKTERKKLGKTLLKYSETITKKYLDGLHK